MDVREGGFFSRTYSSNHDSMWEEASRMAASAYRQDERTKSTMGPGSTKKIKTFKSAWPEPGGGGD